QELHAARIQDGSPGQLQPFVRRTFLVSHFFSNPAARISNVLGVTLLRQMSIYMMTWPVGPLTFLRAVMAESSDMKFSSSMTAPFLCLNVPLKYVHFHAGPNNVPVPSVVLAVSARVNVLSSLTVSTIVCSWALPSGWTTIARSVIVILSRSW